MLTRVRMKAALSRSSMARKRRHGGAFESEVRCRQIFGLDGVLICFSSLALSPQAMAETLATANTAASRAAIVFFIGISLCR